ncbi:MAG: DUF4382 domain-containing protein [Candidatus Aminicenantales bacterium]
MSRIIRRLAVCALAVAGVAGLVFLSACNISSSTSGGTGRVNLLVTDAPSDDWQEVTVKVNSISLRKADDQSWNSVWTADPNDPNSGKLNLVDLSGVAQILGNAPIAAGSYDRLKLVIDTNPSTMKLVDDAGNTIDPANITVLDPSGKGEIKVVISPPMTVADGGVANLQVDFDLAHPLSIVVQNGKVVINLQIRHKAVPRNLRDIQFARNIGNVTAAATDGTSFSLKTLEGADLTFGVDANTIYVDADANATGNFDGLKALVGVADKGALVASNMNSDGSLFARRVWYGDITKLPVFTPEGLVRRVGDNWLKILNKNAEPTAGSGHYCRWDWDVVYVNDATAWTFHDTIPLGTGTAVLQNIRRGFRVSVEFVDPNVTPRVAKSINVQSAHDEGAIRSVSATGFTLGGSGYGSGWNSNVLPNFGQHYTHEWAFSTITDHVFSWWFFGLPSGVSTSVQDFTDTVNQAKGANLRVFVRVELYWDQANSRWVAENVVLAPEKLPDPTRITTAYTAASGSMGVATFDWDDETLPTAMTVFLDTTGDLQTVVGSLRWNSTTRILTFTVPVLPAQWETLLTPSLVGVRVWVRPVKGTDGSYSWHAYTVMAFQVIN